MPMPRLINQPDKCAQPLIFPLDGDAGYDANQQIVCQPDPHLRPDDHIEIAPLEFLIELYANEIAGAGDQVMARVYRKPGCQVLER